MVLHFFKAKAAPYKIRPSGFRYAFQRECEAVSMP